MPGGGKQLPQRPLRIWTSSPDRLCLSSGGGIPSVVFGLLFTTTGLLTLCVEIWLVLVLAGWATASTDPANVVNQSTWEKIGTVTGLFVIGAAHLAGGSLLLWVRRATFDRAHRTVRVRFGWFGVKCERCSLEEFCTVRVIPRTYRNSPYATPYRYDLALARFDDSFLVVGFVTKSPELADEVAKEISEFIGLRMG